MNNYQAILRKLFFISLFLLYLLTDEAFSQDKYNLKFTNPNIEASQWKGGFSSMKLDSTTLIDGKFPLVITQKPGNYLSVFPFLNLLVVNIQQTFLLPDRLQNVFIRIKIQNKCLNMKTLFLKIKGFDKELNTVLDDSVNVNNENQWIRKIYSSELNTAKFLIVQLEGYSPDFQEKESKVYLDRIEVEVNNRQIEDIDDMNCIQLSGKSLSKEFLHSSDSLTTDFIREHLLPTEKIIALGEMVHGSSEIGEHAFRIAKENILHNNCRLFLMEETAAMMLKMDLFVSGKLPLSDIEEIKSDIRLTNISSSPFVEFLLWLRDYNQNTTEKVHLAGFDIQDHAPRNALFDCLYAYYQETHKEFFYQILNCIAFTKYDEVLELLSKSNPLKQSIGDKEYELLYSIIKNLSGLDNRYYRPSSIYTLLNDRDSIMFNHANWFIQKHLRKKEDKALIYTHYLHARKKKNISGPFITTHTFGYYMSEKFKDDYTVVLMDIGEGELTTKSDDKDQYFSTYKLPAPSKYSLENLFMQSKQEVLFYPLQHLPDDTYIIRFAGHKAQIGDEYYDVPKSCADKILFFRTSHSYNIEEKNCFDILFLDKYKKRSKILREIEQKMKQEENK